MKALFLIAIMAASCGVNNADTEDRRSLSAKTSHIIADTPPHMGDTEVDSWTDIFYGKMLEAGMLVNVNVKVRFAEDSEFKDSVIGTCTWYDDWKDVRLKRSWWNEEEQGCRKGMLVIHELGHCSLDLDHAEEGIMSPMLGLCADNDEVLRMLADLITKISEKK